MEQVELFGLLFSLLLFFFCSSFLGQGIKALVLELISRISFHDLIIVNSPEIVKTSVQVFNKSRESTSPEASYATSKIYGDFVALSDSDGNLLAEVPVKKIGEWFWILLTVGVIWKLSGN